MSDWVLGVEAPSWTLAPNVSCMTSISSKMYRNVSFHVYECCTPVSVVDACDVVGQGVQTPKTRNFISSAVSGHICLIHLTAIFIKIKYFYFIIKSS